MMQRYTTHDIVDLVLAEDGEIVLHSEARAEIERLENEVERLKGEAYKANRRAELADGWRDHDKERADKAEKEVERLKGAINGKGL